MHPTVTARLARDFVARAKSGSDAAVRARARLCLQDFLASAFESAHLPWVAQAQAVARASPGKATVIGTALKATTETAAFANAVAGHGLVRDDMHVASISHLGVVVLPAALAMAEQDNRAGSALLDAIVIGYEAGGQLGRAVLDPEVARIHRPTGTIGPFAAAAAGGVLAALDETALAAALGLAAHQAAGYNEWAAAGGTEMFFHPGYAVMAGIVSVRLAGAGAVVSPTVIEGNAGLLAAFGKAAMAHEVHAFAGRPVIDEVFFKEVPACNYAQTAAQAACDLAAESAFDAATLDDIVVRVPAAAASYPGCDVGVCHETLQAKMSIQYNVAAALLTASFDDANFDPARQPHIAALARRVRLEVDDALTRDYPAQQGAEVAVRTADGQQRRKKLENLRAADAERVSARFARAAEARFGAARARRLAHVIDGLDDLASVAPLFAELGDGAALR